MMFVKQNRLSGCGKHATTEYSYAKWSKVRQDRVESRVERT